MTRIDLTDLYAVRNARALRFGRVRHERCRDGLIRYTPIRNKFWPRFERFAASCDQCGMTQHVELSPQTQTPRTYREMSRVIEGATR